MATVNSTSVNTEAQVVVLKQALLLTPYLPRACPVIQTDLTLSPTSFRARIMGVCYYI